MKTEFDSYANNGICHGCKFCLKGQKVVLFMGGKCPRKCWYCSLSETRKKSNTVWANERPCHSIKDIIDEIIQSNAKGAGITGGDPLAYLKKTLSFSKKLKKHFGKKFHIHLYTPLSLVDEKTLKKLHSNIDEIRFHPSFLINSNKDIEGREIEKIIIASNIFGKKNTGIELPLLPEKKTEIINFIKKITPHIGFVNLNEFELSETNFEKVTTGYTLNADSYTILGSIASGKEILKRCKSLPVKIHLCTAKTKNHHQYTNRLKIHKILPYGTKTDEGTVVYFTIIPDNLKKEIRKLEKITSLFYIDKKRNRIIIKKSELPKLYKTKKFNINLCEEYPTFDSERISFWKLSDDDFA